jgi:hypothetical protein
MNDATLWIIAQFGILMEIVGALYIAAQQVSVHSSIGRLFVDIWGIREIPRLVAMMRQQARTDINGFLILAGGLMLQLIGNFGTR